ncbi:hypothetical protein FRC02_005725 [Tulasnella sp. 418]|nr:hypothetical protein FRC02_005725 [Tulasnella sp. 418]
MSEAVVYPTPPTVPPTVPHRQARAIEVLPNPTSFVSLKNVQGDVYPTFPKKAEHFLFFTIKDDARFKIDLGRFIPFITTAAKVVEHLGALKAFKAANANSSERKLMPIEQVQISFSLAGFPHIGINGGVGDPTFDNFSQFEDATSLGDPPAPGTDVEDKIPDWEEFWKSNRVHGAFTIATESPERCRSVADDKIKSIFCDSIDIVHVVEGKVRPEEGHEHFGFLDGISEPAIRGIANPHKGQLQCDAGVVLMGREKDNVMPGCSRPEWALEGSIMVFRKLHQRVPEFNDFLDKNPLILPGLEDDHEKAVALRGARMVGRWKSGAPLDLAPIEDNLDLISDIDKINNFKFKSGGGGQVSGQDRCPFAAHIRKTAPREGATLPPAAAERSLIVRAGIPYGDEVTDEEKDNKHTSPDQDRGLLFVCYNSALDRGFRFMQRTWCNNARFPARFDIETRSPQVGQDPIIGNATGFTRTREVRGTNIGNLEEALTLPEDFVVARGGEYFFVPSINTLERLSRGETLTGTKAPILAGGGGGGGGGAPGGAPGGTTGGSTTPAE